MTFRAMDTTFGKDHHVVARLLAPSASARYQSAREVRDALLAPAIGATVPPRPAALVRAKPSALAPGPRTIEGEVKTRFDQVVISPMRMLYGSHRPGQPLSRNQQLLAVFFGCLTLGLVPLVYMIWHASRRARARAFFERGVPVTGRILQVQKNSYEWFEVTYELTLEGVTHRGTDTMFPAVARLWQVGDEVDVLVLPDDGFDSIIVTSA